MKKFWANVRKMEDCWEWVGTLNDHGYGRFFNGAKYPGTRAHRTSWEIHFGMIPDGLFVCHKCDNRKCVNPDHLFLGTNNDNMRDKIKKGRELIGEQCSWSKLTAHQVTKIIALVNSGASQHFVAGMFNISQSSVSHIVNRKRWRHIHKGSP